MNAITSAIVWISMQVFLFSLIGGAVFVLLRRRGPSTGVVCATTVLALSLSLVLLPASPWPRWISKSEIRNTNFETNSNVGVRDDLGQHPHPSLLPEGAGAEGISMVSAWWQAASQWLQPDAANWADDAKPQAAWTQWIPWILAAGIGLGLARLAAGVWAVGRLRRRSQPIEDAALLGELDQLGRQLQQPDMLSRQRIEVLETAVLRSAATVGWRRPVLLLPADWHTWTETERRVVLAHELAHVARRDYLTGLLARLVSAIHFYQPLVLWLGRQLRIEQELAADAQAATVAGNRQTYLATLAQMALRADEQPLPWAARAFLPGTSMLIKRVAWLKRGQGRSVEKSLSRTGRWLLAAMLAVVVLGVAGIRGPAGISSLVAAAEKDDGKEEGGNTAPPVNALMPEKELTHQSEENLKLLALGCIRMEDKTKYFPTDFRSADGKPLLSWRVAVLPFLGADEKKLFAEFHLDEPWDSAHNKKLIAKMPAIFRDPHERPDSTNSSYFMPTGKGMFGGDGKPIRYADIQDGNANTIMLVEAKRDIPWTKPEDIEIDVDPAKPLPQFGGHMETNNFLAAFADAHVEALREQMDPYDLHAIFTIDGGEALPRESAQSATPIPQGSSGVNRPKLEFRLAETEPGKGLTEAALPGSRTGKIYLHSQVELSGDDIAEAKRAHDDNGTAVVEMTLTDDGAKKMKALSAGNPSKMLAILIDGTVLCAPTIHGTLSNKLQITGSFSQEEIDRLSKTIGGG